VSWRTVRRIAALAVEVAESVSLEGTLCREGRGQGARLAWVRRAGTRGRASDAAALLAALGPWRAMGVPDVGDVLERLFDAAASGLAGERAATLHDLADRGFYYQPYMPRKPRDPDAADQVLSALLWRGGLHVDRYHAMERPPVTEEIDPWTLVHALDGLYVLGPRAGDAEPRLWALHRMEGARWVRERHVRLPDGYHPQDLVGHGYGPFIAAPGGCALRVPAEEAPWVLESPLPGQEGEPEPLRGGAFRVRLAVAPHPGLHLWARAMGVEVEEER